jgi:hypothetical protein
MRRGSTNRDGFVHEEGMTNHASLYMRNETRERQTVVNLGSANRMRMEQQTVVDLYMRRE